MDWAETVAENEALSDSPNDDLLPEDHDQEDRAFTDVRSFMNRIHSDFLSSVEPRQDLLVDELISKGVLTVEDQEKIDQTILRVDRARKLWIQLNGIDKERFGKAAFPALKMYYPQVVQDHEFSLGDQSERHLEQDCLYHVMRKRRITPARFADIFPAMNCCTVDEYNEIAEGGQVGEEPWNRVLSILRRNIHRKGLMEEMAKFFSEIVRIRIPPDFRQRFQDGFLCTCNQASTQVQYEFKTSEAHHPMACDPDETAVHWKAPKVLNDSQSEAKSSSNGYPSTRNEDDDSACSFDSEADAVSSNLDLQSSRFETRRAKLLHAKLMKEISSAITNASCIRAFHRNLEAIEEQSSILALAAEDENQGFTQEDKKMMTIVQVRAKRIRKRQNDLYDEATKTLSEKRLVLAQAGDTNVSAARAKKKLHFLSNEINEARNFLKRSRETLTMICKNCSTVLTESHPAT
ncbi:hypothetical protein BaRGS_00034933 [Batillaria attramentaria]|uniref:CARD domain-containing protein n=1 Tax=Batillaria attramentaria TaxID=370345 RepID=A0ABD0JG68_9CAEN